MGDYTEEGCDENIKNTDEESRKHVGDKRKSLEMKEEPLDMKKPKMTFSMKSSSDPKKQMISSSISLKLGSQKAKEEKVNVVKKPSTSVAKAFNDSDSEEEEMPPEAKMRMRNIGRNTPTSSGPNSFGKTKQGFCNMKKVFERDLKRKMDEFSDT